MTRPVIPTELIAPAFNPATFRRWQCQTCSDIYDEALGLPEYGIAPGTRFEDLPNDWVCPLCGTPKSDFALLGE